MKFLSFFYTLIIFSSFSLQSFSQNNPEDKLAEISTLKKTYISEILTLDATVSEKFWKIYDKREEELNTIQIKQRKLMRLYILDEAELTDNELLKIADGMISQRTDEAKVLEKYHEALKEIITPQQLVDFYHAEFKFKKRMLKKYGKGRGHGAGRDRGVEIDEILNEDE